MRHRLITIVSSTAVALAGCSSAPRNFAPELRFAPANAGVYSAKWHACRQQVADASKDRRDRHQSAAVGAARAGHDTYEIDFFDDDEEEDLDADGRTSVTSLMANLLLDLGNDSGMSFYAGAGAGWARVKNRIEVVDEEDPQDAVNLSKSGLAWQLIAGVRTAVSDNIDLGLKYRSSRRAALSSTGTTRISAILASARASGRTACSQAWCTTLRPPRRRLQRLRRHRRRPRSLLRPRPAPTDRSCW